MNWGKQIKGKILMNNIGEKFLKLDCGLLSTYQSHLSYSYSFVTLNIIQYSVFPLNLESGTTKKYKMCLKYSALQTEDIPP